MSVQVRPLGERDFFDWLALWEGYSEFYNSEVTDTKSLLVWSWLSDKQHDLTGVVAEEDGVLLGFAHVREYPRTLDADRALFLDDLFVVPEARSKGIGAALIETIKGLARERGLGGVSWLTAADNQAAQHLYDQVATRTEWVTYEMDV